MKYKQALEFLEELNVFGINLGLGRITKLLELLGNPQNDYKTVHVTGTNGKGSVTAMLAEILKKSGIRTGMYISPHLSSYTERIQVDGSSCSEAEFAAALEVVQRAMDIMDAKGEEHPTQFEVLTAAAFVLFQLKKVEYAVIEVGLGGLLDSTNVIVPAVSVITNVSLEHADKCGGTLEGIAEHKAGIIKTGIPVVTGAEGIALDIIRETAAANGCDIYVMGEDFYAEPVNEPKGQLSIPPNLGVTGTGVNDRALMDMQIEALSSLSWSKFSLDDDSQAYQLTGFRTDVEVMGNMEYRLALLGLHQVSNSSLAVAAAMVLATDDLRITRSSIKKGMASVKWPGRFEQLTGYDFSLLIDGAHNSAGVTVLRQSLDYYYPDQNRVFLLGILKDKAFEEMLDILLRPEDKVVFTAPLSDRAASPEELLSLPKTKELRCARAESDYKKALSMAKEMAAESDDTMLICAGSLYLIGALRELLLTNR